MTIYLIVFIYIYEILSYYFHKYHLYPSISHTKFGLGTYFGTICNHYLHQWYILGVFAVENFCDLPSLFTTVTNLFVYLGLYKGLVWIRLFGEELILPVVSYGVVFTAHVVTTKNCWVIGKANCVRYVAYTLS